MKVIKITIPNYTKFTKDMKMFLQSGREGKIINNTGDDCMFISSDMTLTKI